MSELRYTLVEGRGRGREYPVATNQYFARRGGKFVYSNAGNMTLCGSANSVFGWCESSKDDAGKNAVKSLSGDENFVYYADDDNVFEIPAWQGGASLAASQIGLSFKLITKGATYAQVQYARVANTTASPLNVVGIDTTNNTVRVKIEPHSRQK